MNIFIHLKKQIYCFQIVYFINCMGTDMQNEVS